MRCMDDVIVATPDEKVCMATKKPDLHASIKL